MMQRFDERPTPSSSGPLREAFPTCRVAQSSRRLHATWHPVIWLSHSGKLAVKPYLRESGRWSNGSPYRSRL